MSALPPKAASAACLAGATSLLIRAGSYRRVLRLLSRRLMRTRGRLLTAGTRTSCIAGLSRRLLRTRTIVVMPAARASRSAVSLCTRRCCATWRLGTSRGPFRSSAWDFRTRTRTTGALRCRPRRTWLGCAYNISDVPVGPLEDAAVEFTFNKIYHSFNLGASCRRCSAG